MKITKKIAAVLSVVAGVFFLFNMASDIQLGTGLVLIFVGVLGFPLTETN